tara:strand:+ start:786 stop:1073 length:288 start_codon:yes stop_codon:yes gene_type:complete
MSKNRKGDFAELYAVTWLWDQGYEAFKNYGSDGIVDMIAWNPTQNKIVLIDVKTLHTTKPVNGGRPRTDQQKKLNVRQVGFDPVTRKAWWVEHRE